MHSLRCTLGLEGIFNVLRVLEIISPSVAEAVLPCADSEKSF